MTFTYKRQSSFQNHLHPDSKVLCLNLQLLSPAMCTMYKLCQTHHFLGPSPTPYPCLQLTEWNSTFHFHYLKNDLIPESTPQIFTWTIYHSSIVHPLHYFHLVLSILLISLHQNLNKKFSVNYPFKTPQYNCHHS